MNIGHEVVEKPPFFMEHGGTKVIHINYKSAQVDQVYFPQIEVVGDIALSVDALAAALGSKLDIDLGDFETVRDNVKGDFPTCRGANIPDAATGDRVRNSKSDGVSRYYCPR